ncbi:kinesin-like protein KIN-5B [Ipomoea triloba]|uniref:kinesin-like protein KIN-5B n=1 Tax=Ipomoea triloba TaxID=35885 RepID=UPI00125E24D8|nr:kinesin-like protein KIN-5B [Ipomoea triloba]
MASLTPDVTRKSRAGMSPSPAPFYTPRPERRRPDSRGSENNRFDKDREVNVQVILRCRPLDESELKLNVPRVITCNENRREVTVSQNVANKQLDRVFTFDKVFGPKAQQRSIYDQAISPIVNEVLEGYNCTVFAYGQTGTGKTYTMEGGTMNKVGELPVEAGVIPRAVRQIFDTLEAQNADYSMKVTFLELYNEEITDLLASEEPSKYLEDKQKKSVSLLEDGKGCVIVRGLEEEVVYSANDIYNLLERGAAKRRTADTLLNKHSSRSHSIFSITVHVKETSIGDEELVKCGKLNLVDLAGSENISRSGAREGRAREAGEINKSLLTLGRVIYALVEHSAHIPYRDSKLTRLLRDSLGGKTKTCIIATISPSANCLEETLSTLDYAYRAKNIKNKPEVNQKMSKTMLLKDLYQEIERMKQDVRAAREKNGVYIPHERFLQDEAEKKAKNGKIEQLENDLDVSEKQVDKFRELYYTEQEEKLSFKSELKDCKINLEKSNSALQDLQENYYIAVSTLKEKDVTITKLLHSENRLIGCAKELRESLHNASNDVTSLFARLDEKDSLEEKNRSLLRAFGSQLDESLKDLQKIILGSVSQQQQQMIFMDEYISSFLASKCNVTKVMESKIAKMMEMHASGIAELKVIVDTLQQRSSSDLEQMKSNISSQATTLEDFILIASMEAKDVISDMQNFLNDQRQILAFSAQQQREGLHRSMLSAQTISQATANFFDDLHQRASELMTFLEDSKIDKIDQLQKFEKSFKEEALKEEKAAAEKIGAILAALTAKKTVMVSEMSRNIQNSSVEENKRLHQELSGFQQVSVNAKKELNGYVEKVKNNFVEDTFASAESRVTLDNCLQECTNKVDHFNQQWENTTLGVNKLTKDSLAETESVVQTKTAALHGAHEEFISASSSMHATFNQCSHDLLTSVNDSLMKDRESKKEINSMSTTCSTQLNSMQQTHGEFLSNIQNRTEQCLQNVCKADQNADRTPKKREIRIPSIASIEEMATPISEINLENRSKQSGANGKIQQDLKGASPNRTPFTNVN